MRYFAKTIPNRTNYLTLKIIWYWTKFTATDSKQTSSGISIRFSTTFNNFIELASWSECARSKDDTNDENIILNPSHLTRMFDYSMLGHAFREKFQWLDEHSVINSQKKIDNKRTYLYHWMIFSKRTWVLFSWTRENKVQSFIHNRVHFCL